MLCDVTWYVKLGTSCCFLTPSGPVGGKRISRGEGGGGFIRIQAVATSAEEEEEEEDLLYTETGLVVRAAGLLSPRNPYACMYRQCKGETVTLQGGRYGGVAKCGEMS